MPRLNYVPSNRTLRIAITSVVVVAMIVFAGLSYVAVVNTLQLRETNARLDQSQAERDALLERVKRNGVLLSFMDQAPDGLQEDITYRCRVKVRDQAYVCRPIPPP